MADLTSLSGYTTSYRPNENRDNPPPAPPKSRSSTLQSIHGRSASLTGPPLPPPPPTHSSTPPSQTPLGALQQQLPPPILPPGPGETWLPSIVQDKTTQQLAPLLSSPDQIRALAQIHPSLHPKNSPLPPLLAQTSQLSQQLSQQHAQLLLLRDRTQRHLLHLHALERQWREKQAQLDMELEPWSAKTLYGRLREAEREAETVGEALERSWLDGDGVMEEREILDFLRGYREGRGRVWRRREMRERWDEGRVGGWR